LIECFQKRDNDIADDREGDENIECTADTVALVADLDDVKYFFFHNSSQNIFFQLLYSLTYLGRNLKMN